jgi:hypothetical protein
MNNLILIDLVKTLQNFKVTRKQTDEVLVQRQLKCWLEPGWCMPAPAGSEPKLKRERKLMLWWIAGVLMLSGLAGLVTGYRMEGVISIALMLVIVIALVGLFRDWMSRPLKERILQARGGCRAESATES